MMCDRGLLTVEKLRESLDAAFPFSLRATEEEDPDDPDWSRAYATFRRVVQYLQGKIRAI